jgi:type II secretory pathway pseudopilin PulG
MGNHSQQIMTHEKNAGFTIIETMLVLAITGLLITGLLVGLGSSIGVQRYRDAVSSLKATMQAQYAAAEDVTNSRDDSWTCGSSAIPVQGAEVKAPGQSDCVILGRYMSIDDTNITTATVIGFETPQAPATNELMTIRNNYTFGIATDTIARSTLEWGAQIAWPASGGGSRSQTTPRAISILFLRSPVSGTSYTFTNDNAPLIEAVSSDVLKGMMAQARQGQRTICVDPNGVTVPENFAVYISAGASSSDAVQTRSNATIRALGGDSVC